MNAVRRTADRPLHGQVFTARSAAGAGAGHKPHFSENFLDFSGNFQETNLFFVFLAAS